MANIKSAKKRILVSKARQARNRARKSELKTYLKKFEQAVLNKDRAAAEEAYKVAIQTVDRAVARGILHRNNAARKKSKLTLQLNSLQG